MSELPEVTEQDEIWCKHYYHVLVMHALTLHADQVDKGGEAYGLHLLFVAEHQNTYAGRVIALYHDSIEDEKTTAQGLLTYGLPKSIVARIEVLSRRLGQTYEEFVIATCRDIYTRLVKKWDLKHNLQLDRRPEITQGDVALIRRYQRALALIMEFERAQKPTA